MEPRTTTIECVEWRSLSLFSIISQSLLGWLLFRETLSVMFWGEAVLILIDVFIVITEKPKEEDQNLLSASRKNA